MKLKSFISCVSDLPWFDTNAARIRSGMDSESLRIYLSRWIASGDIVSVRRGLYVLERPWRRIEPHPLALAQAIQPRSYVSCEAAAQFHGLIPDGVFVQTSLTLRKPGEFETPFGRYAYKNIHPDLFGGAVPKVFDDGQPAMIASPAKTLVDLFYCGRGVWPMERIEALRLQNLEIVDLEDGRKWTEKFPTLKKTWSNFEKFHEQEMEAESCAITL